MQYLFSGSKDLGRPGSITNTGGGVYHGSTRNSYSMTLGGSSGSWAAAASATRSNVQYNPAGDTRQRVRTSSLEIGFLGNLNDDSFDHITIEIILRKFSNIALGKLNCKNY